MIFFLPGMTSQLVENKNAKIRHFSRQILHFAFCNVTLETRKSQPYFFSHKENFLFNFSTHVFRRKETLTFLQEEAGVRPKKNYTFLLFVENLQLPPNLQDT